MTIDFFVLYEYPIWTTGLTALVVMGLAVEFGFRVGLRKRKQWPDAEIGGGGVVLTAVLALLGLILAFTYSASASRYDARKQAVIVEANAIGTAFLRAGLVAEPGSTELREALLHYAETRVVDRRMIRDERDVERLIERSIEAQIPLWPITERIVRASARGPIEASLVASVNEVIDEHTVRLAALLDKLPTAVLSMLLLIAVGAMALTGFNAGVSGCISRWRLTLFALVLSGVMFVIVDLDRPNDGFVRVSLASIEATIADMKRTLAGAAEASLGSAAGPGG